MSAICFEDKGMKLTTMVLGALFIGLALAGCNTIHGVGKDIEKGGEAIQRAVR